jgi:UDP-2-acetamido-3-amino-2,3-dideoxy-glucuronate N-acetyltransferase
MTTRVGVSIHPSADVAESAELGEGTRVWHQAQVRERAVVGRECILGKGVYVDFEVHIGDRCKLQNGVFVFHGFNLEAGVFVGPGAILLNDKNPRAINPDGSLKSDADWNASEGLVKQGASLGGGAVVLPGVTIGRFAIVGSGAVVTREIPDHGMVYGNPARLKGFVCACGHVLTPGDGGDEDMHMTCPADGTTTVIPASAYAQMKGRE